MNRDENLRTAWGYTFKFDKSSHPTPEQLQPLKHSYDRLAEEALEVLYSISPSSKVPLPRNTPRNEYMRQDSNFVKDDMPSKPRMDFYALLEEHHASDPVLERLWAETNTVPAWVDWQQLARGQDVFYLYGGPMFTGLAFQSLLGGMAAGRVVETLARSGGFSTKVAKHRIYETTQHILQCTRSLQSIQPGGEGHAASVRVRLLHAAVRRRIVALSASRPEYYDIARLGVPINDLDCIGTIASFSCILIWISLPRQGIFMTRRETEDFVALWRYIAYLMGTPDEYFETPERAKTMLEVLMLYELKPTETSKVLANNVIRCLQDQPPSFASRNMLEASTRFLNGHELCDALGLGRPSSYYYLLSWGQCFFFMGICYFYRSVPFLRRRKITVSRSYPEEVTNS